ncbi:cupin domain-containing protein [Lihuaxuella thermophila]|uniref:Cupin domain-containing protein n=1 Tax=Lihuaxuella thermophila TaxID=1173111 RepID=A0A1H8CHS2_9BACL|nr:cupin domain-containing protein [Lihuaxuella thermophila]SEM94502.1 Cupin domain-containing protein [Lihuaxuella thermophila]
MNTIFDRPRVLRGEEVTLEQAVMELLPVTGSVEVQRDTPGREHPTHTHPTHETLLIVSGSITFTIGEESWKCTSGDRLILPKGTLHSSIAGEEGCVYIIRLHETE